MKLFVLLSLAENRYLVLSRCSYIVLDEVSSFNLFYIFCVILNQIKNKLFDKVKCDGKPYSILDHSSLENLSHVCGTIVG